MDPLHSPPSYRLTRFCRLGPLPLVQLLDDRPYTPADVTPAADIMGAISSKPFTPAYADVCAARATLKSLKLPTELVLQILDHARYWPSYEFKGSKVSAENGASISLLENIYDRANVFGSLATNEALKVKEIEFEIRSRDQGWTSEGTEGTYQTSSWLEVSILRPEGTNPEAIDPRWPGINSSCEHSGKLHHVVQDHGWTLVSRPASASRSPQDNEDNFAWYLQANKVAAKKMYNIVWAQERWVGNEGSGKGEGFLEALKEGDRILVWARAKWPGWMCEVDSLTMTVRYGF